MKLWRYRRRTSGTAPGFSIFEAAIPILSNFPNCLVEMIDDDFLTFNNLLPGIIANSIETKIKQYKSTRAR